MPLRASRASSAARSQTIDRIRSWSEPLGESATMLCLAVGVCLSWPELGRAVMLASKIAFVYCFYSR